MSYKKIHAYCFALNMLIFQTSVYPWFGNGFFPAPKSFKELIGPGLIVAVLCGTIFAQRWCWQKQLAKLPYAKTEKEKKMLELLRSPEGNYGIVEFCEPFNANPSAINRENEKIEKVFWMSIIHSSSNKRFPPTGRYRVESRITDSSRYHLGIYSSNNKVTSTVQSV
jgi:hypothetical protein